MSDTQLTAVHLASQRWKSCYSFPATCELPGQCLPPAGYSCGVGGRKSVDLKNKIAWGWIGNGLRLGNFSG